MEIGGKIASSNCSDTIAKTEESLPARGGKERERERDVRSMVEPERKTATLS